MCDSWPGASANANLAHKGLISVHGFSSLIKFGVVNLFEQHSCHCIAHAVYA